MISCSPYPWKKWNAGLAWRIEFDPRAADELARLDPQHRRRILRFLKERIAPLHDPRSAGDPLRGPLRKLWKYRIGNYRLITDIRDKVLLVLVLRIGHRREIYRR
jgi:mRNA interferase RelE/StbE